ncbi:hypothetical protein COU74_04645 [Candidatus Peregrinibacteria bacterium CG10_big_fil_rev_8_21_14_0_10_36_19]|nr:MAG: hypothetical protein COU74_04645 [Candidatus Peregrinibacteria bacterium CG10_big_fil_rev_8_21_14_0_10_36_19]
MFEKNLENQDVQFNSGPSKSSTLAGVFLVLVSIALYMFFIKGFVSEVEVKASDINDKQVKILEMKNKIAEITAAEQKWDVSTEVQRAEVLKSIPVGLNQDEVIQDLVRIAKLNDIELNSVSFGRGSEGKDGIGSLRINSSFEGNYSDLVGFLKEIEENGRLFKVNSINVQVNTFESSSFERISFALNLEAYYQN